MVQVSVSSWQNYNDGDITACTECMTYGCQPLMVYVCDLQSDPQSPRSSTNLDSIGPVLQREMDIVPSRGAKLVLERLPVFSKILNQIIHYEFNLWCTGKQTDEPTGVSVYHTMTSHCEKAWVELQ